MSESIVSLHVQANARARITVDEAGSGSIIYHLALGI
jgi:hypothetical protein